MNQSECSLYSIWDSVDIKKGETTKEIFFFKDIYKPSKYKISQLVEKTYSDSNIVNIDRSLQLPFLFNLNCVNIYMGKQRHLRRLRIESTLAISQNNLLLISLPLWADLTTILKNSREPVILDLSQNYEIKIDFDYPKYFDYDETIRIILTDIVLASSYLK